MKLKFLCWSDQLAADSSWVSIKHELRNLMDFWLNTASNKSKGKETIERWRGLQMSITVAKNIKSLAVYTR